MMCKTISFLRLNKYFLLLNVKINKNSNIALEIWLNPQIYLSPSLMTSVSWIPTATYNKALIIHVTQMWSVHATTVTTAVWCAYCYTNDANNI